MKTIRLYAAIVFAAVALSSCDEQYGDAKMHTTINSDGTCSRSIDFKLEFDAIPNGIDLGSDWVSIPNDDTARHAYVRNFDNVEQMSMAMPLRLNKKPLSSKATLEKRFRWFYTEYTFTEVFAGIGGNFPQPPTDYADAEEVNYWFTGQPNIVNGMNGAETMERLSDLETKMNNWFSDNVINSALDYIYTHYDSIAEPPVSREQFAQLHDSLATFIRNQSGKEILAYDSRKGFQEFFKSDAYSIFFRDSSYCAKGLYDNLTPIVNFSFLSVPYALTMPGKVTNPGNGILSDGVITYTLSGERLIPADYTITATSRQTNIWAYVVTAIVILLAIGSWVWKSTPKVP
ncbi:MAG: hypothetical protein IJ894_06230 [Bacteroidales bacterium]|nr:hypothetical protein [Bacteroidales bacterium]MBR2200329.1 hypothetical protein [Bacteroidales bacterium]